MIDFARIDGTSTGRAGGPASTLTGNPAVRFAPSLGRGAGDLHRAVPNADLRVELEIGGARVPLPAASFGEAEPARTPFPA